MKLDSCYFPVFKHKPIVLRTSDVVNLVLTAVDVITGRHNTSGYSIQYCNSRYDNENNHRWVSKCFKVSKTHRLIEKRMFFSFDLGRLTAILQVQKVNRIVVVVLKLCLTSKLNGLKKRVTKLAGISISVEAVELLRFREVKGGMQEECLETFVFLCQT